MQSRIDDYLSTYHFYPNNIDFRIKSSKALEKWKNVQAFQLNQLVNGRFYFSHTRREILLLKYDLWSKWLYEVENLCIELGSDHSENRVTEHDIQKVLDLAQKTTLKYKEIMTSGITDRFDVDFVTIWLEVHELIYHYMLKCIETSAGKRFDHFFISLVDTLVEVMQYTLIEIHELDIIFCYRKENCNFCYKNGFCKRQKTKELLDGPFIVMVDISENAYRKFGNCLITERLKIYKNHFELEEIYIKNYTDETLSPELIERIEGLGVNINFKKSLVR